MLLLMSMEAIRFTNTSIDEIRIDDSSRYPPDEFLHEDDPSRQYLANSEISYYITPHGHSLTELTKTIMSLNNTETSVPVTETLAPEVPQSHITHHASTSSYLDPQDRWSRDQHIELMNIIGEPTECILTRSMDAKLIVALASECLFADFLPKIEPKKVFKNKKDELGTVIRNKARLVTQGFSQEEEINYDETFAPVARMEAIRFFLAFAIYMNFKVFQLDVKSAFLNGKLKEEVYVKQPPGFESSEFPDYVCKLDRALYGPKQALKECAQDLILKDTQTQTMLVAIWTKKAPQVLVNCLKANWFVEVKRNTSQWLCPLLKVEDPNPPTNEYEAHPLKEFIIKFTVKNGQMLLTLDYKTFCETTGLDYNKGDYVAHPSLKVVKVELAKIAINEALVLGGNHSSTKQLNLIQHLIVFSLLTGTKIDIGEIVFIDLVTRLRAKSRQIYVSYPRFVSCDLEELLEMFEAGEEMDEAILQSANEETQTPHSIETSTEEPISTEHQSPLPHKDDLESLNAKKSTDYPDASDSVSSLCSETFKPFDNYILVTAGVLNAAKEDSALNKKVLEAAEAYIKNSTNLTELLTLVKNFYFPNLKSTVESLLAAVTAQNDHLAKWVESSALMAWSIIPRMTRIENTQTNI
ncbi:retrovirus-related pol polyprotein from transposon TNT 1-94 [Tanacetum coccineum]|uniref:Retrovirus-related pol polyprotein from transposon TNT 1-94 n=1 Tax=Tanacetum coccineum TaxID=301880 RepID=A0ABQ5G5R7_9ASTR